MKNSQRIKKNLIIPILTLTLIFNFNLNLAPYIVKNKIWQMKKTFLRYLLKKKIYSLMVSTFIKLEKNFSFSNRTAFAKERCCQNMSSLSKTSHQLLLTNNITEKENKNISPELTQLLSPTISLDNNSTIINFYNFIIPLLKVFLNSTDNTNNQLNLPSLTPYPNITISNFLNPTVSFSNNEKPIMKEGLIYYPQCQGKFDYYPLPSGCTICSAGCGPTTVSMIIASYVDKKITPIDIVNLYRQKGYYLGCQGSTYFDAKSIIHSYGLKTTDYIFNYGYNGVTIEQIVQELRNYINSGWTIFALANFQAGGHYFWIINVDEKNNVWAFDPYYGRYQIPFNENSYYPFPRYRIAFGVKK